jgi:GTP-binding protein EngB required for normal cell division
LKDRTPLTPAEWKEFRQKIGDCGLKGLPFDDVSYLFPLQIPSKLRVQVLQEKPRIVSVLTIYDRTGLVGVIGDGELENYYLNHSGAFIFAVGKMDKCKKNDKEYLNLRPRGWLLVKIEDSNKMESIESDEKGPDKKRKK